MTELDITQAICVYLRRNKYLFKSNYFDGLYLSPYQAKLVSKLKSEDKFPDLFIFNRFGIYVGMALEIKREKSAFLLKNGEMRVNDKHIQQQILTLAKLIEQGWYCEFVTSVQDVEHAIMTLEGKHIQKILKASDDIKKKIKEQENKDGLSF